MYYPAWIDKNSDHDIGGKGAADQGPGACNGFDDMIATVQPHLTFLFVCLFVQLWQVPGEQTWMTVSS